MEKRIEKKTGFVEWANLPAELLATISSGFTDPRDTVRFRSVCQWWRLSTPLPPNRLSPFLPRVSAWRKVDLHPFGLRPESNFLINATSVYIIRQRWMVSVQEPVAGTLVLRDALFYKEIKGDHPDLDPYSIVATQIPIAKSYSYNARCLTCNGVCSTEKVELLFEPDFSLLERFRSYYKEDESVPECSGLEWIALYASKVFEESVVLVSWQDLINDCAILTSLSVLYQPQRFRDFVKFNGRFYAVDFSGCIFFVDPTDFEIYQMTENSVIPSDNSALSVNFVVSDGDLYLVWRENRSSCQIYKILVVVTDNDEGNKKFSCDGILIEKVEDLGDKVFFVTPMWCFSVSVRLLPHPWRGNCIFFSDRRNSMCKCPRESDFQEHHEVFDVGAQTFTEISSLQGYSDLFSLPVSFVVSKKTENGGQQG